MSLKYGIGDTLKVKNSKVVGEVIQTEYRKLEGVGKVEETKKYGLKIKGYGYPQWYVEDLLEEVIEDITPESEAKVDYLLKDVFLKAGKYDIVKGIQEKYGDAN